MGGSIENVADIGRLSYTTFCGGDKNGSSNSLSKSIVSRSVCHELTKTLLMRSNIFSS